MTGKIIQLKYQLNIASVKFKLALVKSFFQVIHLYVNSAFIAVTTKMLNVSELAFSVELYHCYCV